MNPKEQNQFIDRLTKKKSRVMVIGLGYTGLPLVECIANAGFNVLGFDKNSFKIASLIRGESYLETFSSSRLASLLKTGRFLPKGNLVDTQPCDVYWICVPTPLSNGAPTLDLIFDAVASIANHTKKPFLVVVSSTSFPGTSRLLSEKLQNDCELVLGEDFFLACSPEREDPGNKKYNTQNLPRVFGASDQNSLKISRIFFKLLFDEIYEASSIETAEASKLMENVYRAVNIALANEWSEICKGLNLNVWEVVNLASTKPFGFQAFFPGPGVGGHCIPVDPYYLITKLKSTGINSDLINLACDLNKKRPLKIVEKIIDLVQKHHNSILNFNILLIGIGYKKNMADIRESPSLEILHKLSELGFNARWHDPLVVDQIPELSKLKESILTKSLLKQQGLCLVLVDHDQVDWAMLENNANLIIDTVNSLHLRESKQVIRI